MNTYEVRIYDIPAMEYVYEKVQAYSEEHAMEVADKHSPYFIIQSAKLIQE